MIYINKDTVVHSISELLGLPTKLIMDPSLTSNEISKLSCFFGLSLVRESYLFEFRYYL